MLLAKWGKSMRQDLGISLLPEKRRGILTIRPASVVVATAYPAVQHQSRGISVIRVEIVAIGVEVVWTILELAVVVVGERRSRRIR